MAGLFRRALARLPYVGAMSSGRGEVMTTRQPVQSHARPIRARYDAATDDHHNSRHWAMADGLSARQANSAGVREKLRNRSRYETANNCYARGMLNTLADVEVGFGAACHIPRPRRATRGLHNALKDVEAKFETWAIESGFWLKLWTARVTKGQDGEALAVFRTNPKLETPVTLDLQWIEAEQCTHGPMAAYDPRQVDGVDVDDHGNPVTYWVLPDHPGDAYAVYSDPFPVPARNMIHWYRIDRPGQLRGIPEITPALPLFAQLRRFTLATITAAETAADIAGVITSSITPEYGEEAPEDEPLALHDIYRGQWMELPDGRDINQLKAEHPTTTYKDFKREILAEIGRCLQLPLGYILGDWSLYNYASGRLGRQELDRHVDVGRFRCEQQVMRKVWDAWFAEASRIPGYLEEAAITYLLGRRPRWMWGTLGHVDRAKEETGREKALANGTTTLAAECGRDGEFWEDVMEQRMAERARRQELEAEYGLEPEPETARAGKAANSVAVADSGPTEEEEEVEEDEQAAKA